MSASLRTKLTAHEPTIGSWIQAASPTVAEVLDGCGFDWLAIDCEHTDIGLNELAGILRGIRSATPLVRVKNNDALSIRQPLDCGAQGVIVPLVNSAAEAAAAVAAAHYPPVGVRGYAYCRANNHGLRFDEYATAASTETVVIVMIESAQAVRDIDAIVGVDGVDGVFVGPYDLSGSLGVPGQPEHKLVMKALDAVVSACLRAGKAAGQHIVQPEPEAIARSLEQGYTFLALGMDTVFLANGARKCIALASESRNASTMSKNRR